MSTEGQGSASRARGEKWGKKRGEGMKEGGQAAGVEREEKSGGRREERKGKWVGRQRE